MTKFETFAALHVPGDPLVLYNVWDPGSAKAAAAGGAAAIATGSWSVAVALGYADGEDMPLEVALDAASRIVAATDLATTIDFEAGYAVAPEAVAENAARLVATGAVGCNFEDQVIGGAGVHPVATQAARLAALCSTAGGAFFVNARTDLFLQAPADAHAGLIDAALERAIAYADAGASGFFVPGLGDRDLIARVCAGSPLPVNVMWSPGRPSRAELAELGVARISHGPGPYRAAMTAFGEGLRQALA